MKWFWWICILKVAIGRLPEESMTAPEIIEYYGYPVEIIEVKTQDGYILNLHRIPFGKNETVSSPTPKPVVFLQHGLLGSSGDWVTNLPHQSAGFVFADAGFDVWLGNVRGNFYSRKHEKYSTLFPTYWKFSWDEMAAHDLTAMIEAVLNITEQESLYYVGHSQGTEIMFAKLSSDPTFGQKIKKFFALAPVGAVGYVKGLLAYIGKNLVTEFDLMVRIFGAYDFLPSNWFTRMFAEIICGPSFMNPLCDNVLFQIGGPDTDNFNKSRLMVYLSHVPAGTSTMNIAHWAQMTRSKTVQKYDFGAAGNQKAYGRPTPPLYNYSNVNVPTYLYYSTQDWLSDPIDVQNSLLNVIPKQYLKLSKNLVDYDHFDFIWGIKANERIYQDVIQRIKAYETTMQRRKLKTRP